MSFNQFLEELIMESLIEKLLSSTSNILEKGSRS